MPRAEGGEGSLHTLGEDCRIDRIFIGEILSPILIVLLCRYPDKRLTPTRSESASMQRFRFRHLMHPLPCVL